MSVNKLIVDALTPLSVPVEFMRYDNDSDTYIVFLEYNQTPWLQADNEEMLTKHFFQVDIFSIDNYSVLVKKVKKAMKEAGFGRMFESETYDDNMQKYRKILRFSYISASE